jgi:hypothetical protein
MVMENNKEMNTGFKQVAKLYDDSKMVNDINCLKEITFMLITLGIMISIHVDQFWL